MPPSEHLLSLWEEWGDGEERVGTPRFCLKLPPQSKQLKKRSELLLLCAELSPLMVEYFFPVGRIKTLHKRLAADPKILLSGKLTYRVNESFCVSSPTCIKHSVIIAAHNESLNFMVECTIFKLWTSLKVLLVVTTMHT